MNAPFQNPDLSVPERVRDLLDRLAFDEKLQMFSSVWPQNERLGLPAMRFGGECLHGLCHTGRATVFPSPIALAATFDPECVRQVADAISTEARAKINDPAWSESPFLSLAFWTPNINLFRDPRWGRGQETYGEDPYLSGEMGVAFVQGLQGDDPHYLKTAACAKHFAVHSGPEAIRTSFNAQVGMKLLRDTYLPHFQRLVEGGAAVVMGAYNALNGEPCCGSKTLLQDLLRTEWGFEGFVVSDAGAIAAFHRKKKGNLRADQKDEQWGFLAEQMAELEGHGVTGDDVESAALAIRCGCDMALGADMTADIVRQAAERGLVEESDLNRSLSRALTIAFRLGIYDPKDRQPFRDLNSKHIQCTEHISLARKTAAQGSVLLKNNGILPLNSETTSVAVSGPTAADAEVLLGNFYRGVSANLRTLLEGIVEAAPEGTRVTYLKGTGLHQPNLFESTWAIGMAENADVIVACIGNSPLMEGEHGECIGTTLGGDRDRMDLPEVQLHWLRRAKKETGKPLVAVVTSGSPILMEELHDLADAILLAWYPGEQGGSAVGDILFGHSEPGGRLPVTFPMNADQVPDFADYSMQGRTYRYLDAEPLYPFGFGLGYTQFAYSDLQLSSGSLTVGEKLDLQVTLRNIGDRKGETVAQLYLADDGDTEGPRCNLRQFKRVCLGPGESTLLRMTLTPNDFNRVDAEGRSLPGTGTFTATVSDGAPGPRAAVLGAPAGPTATFRIQEP